MLVPSPAFRSMALGIALGRLRPARDADAAALCGARQARPRVDVRRAALGALGEHRSPCFPRWGERLWRRLHALYGAGATALLVLLALPVLGLGPGCSPSKSSPRTTARASATRRCSKRSALAPSGALQLVASRGDAQAVARIATADPGIARVSAPQQGGNGLALVQAIPESDPSSKAVGRTIDRRTRRPGWCACRRRRCREPRPSRHWRRGRRS